MQEFITQNSWLIWPFLVWTLYWKGRALWITALKRHKWWFIALLVINTLGIFEIIYIYYISKRKFKVTRVFTQMFVGAGAIIEKDGKILLVKEGFAGPDKGKWNQPAGWVEVGDDPIAGVKIEVKEETGLEFEPTALIGVYSLVRDDIRQHMHSTPHVAKFMFKGNVTGGELKAEDAEEITELKYFSREEIEKMTSAELRDIDIKQIVKDYFNGKSYPLDAIHHTIAK